MATESITFMALDDWEWGQGRIQCTGSFLLWDLCMYCGPHPACHKMSFQWPLLSWQCLQIHS